MEKKSYCVIRGGGGGGRGDGGDLRGGWIMVVPKITH